MLGRKFFVTIGAVFFLLLISLPANAATYGFWGTLDNPSDSVNSIEWGYETDSVNKLIPGSFYVDFWDTGHTSITFGITDLDTPSPGTDPLLLGLNLVGDPLAVVFSTEPEPGKQLAINTLIDPDYHFSLSGVSDEVITGKLGGIPEAVPIPGAAWLLGSGLLGLFGLRRRNRKA